MGVKEAFLSRLLASSDTFSDEQVAQTISMLVEHGVKHRASDIHIEPQERFVNIRYRIDGRLRSMQKLPLAALPAIVKQIKDLAHLRPDETRLPQEGQYAVLVDDAELEIQVSTMPVIGGEKVVLHIARRLNEPPALEELGFWGPNLAKLRQVLTHPHGLVMVAAPRRNGTTTTLHSLLRLLRMPAVSIATVEQSLSYRLPGASQTILRPAHGISPADCLQAALNQDPNVLMLSDMRDKKSADLVISAASSGHFLLVGIHADSATAALAHLRAMGDEPYLLTHAFRAALSQRLLRRLCAHCRIAYAPLPEDIKEIEKAFGLTTASARASLHMLDQQAAAEGLGGKDVHTTPTRILQLWRAHDEGCEACNYTGYQGALAAIEVLTETPALQSTLLTTTDANKLRRLALKEHFIPMEIDGLIKAVRGQTMLAEVLRTVPGPG